jgi:hypothetical protein
MVVVVVVVASGPNMFVAVIVGVMVVASGSNELCR